LFDIYDASTKSLPILSSIFAISALIAMGILEVNAKNMCFLRPKQVLYYILKRSRSKSVEDFLLQVSGAAGAGDCLSFTVAHYSIIATRHELKRTQIHIRVQ
jgi:hypothetical protein